MPARIWPPPDEEEQQHTNITLAEDVAILDDWLVQFAILLAAAEEADRFARAYGMRFQSSAVTSRRDRCWVALRVGATGEQEAGLLAAMTVKLAAALRLAKVRPLAAELHHVERLGGLEGPTEVRRRAERAELLALAQKLAPGLPQGGSGPSTEAGADRVEAGTRRALTG